MFYTTKEKTEKKYTTDFAYKQAFNILKSKYYLSKVCTNKLPRNDNLLTLVELDYLIQELIDDTLFHEGKWF